MGHLYNSTVWKAAWFVRRFGFKELYKKPIRMMLAPIVLSRLPREHFAFRGNTLDCFYHAYNTTWANERCIEVPIGRFFISGKSPEEILEVGNVLSHYRPCQHQVVDKFETGPNIINEDIAAFQPGRKYSLILSLSTFEHIGFDDESAGGGAARISEAISACRRLLDRGGKLVITVPIGYNPGLDERIRSGMLGASREDYLVRRGERRWEERPRSEAIEARYGAPFPYGNAILVAEFDCGPSG